MAKFLGVTTVEARLLDVTLVLDTSAYATGDLLSDVVEIPNAVREANGTGIIQSVTLLDKDDKGTALDLYFTNLSTSWGTFNVALAAADTTTDDIFGVVEVAAADYTDLIISQIAHFGNLGIGVKGDSTGSLYVAAAARATQTYTASGITLRIYITY